MQKDMSDFGKETADDFRKLPERAQELWFGFCKYAIFTEKYELMAFQKLEGFKMRKSRSPIEIIFKLAVDLLTYMKYCPSSILESQYCITREDNIPKYYIDFAFIASDHEYLNIKNRNFKLAIECDGHEFHEKTSRQVDRDNRRNYDLSMAGFDVLRYSGSRIYKEPIICALEAFMYIEEKAGLSLE